MGERTSYPAGTFSWAELATSDDEAAARVGEAGGTVMAEPFDVTDAGRMAAIADPTGAALYLWEARSNPGAGLVTTPGSMTWNDLVTPDADAAARFYGALFGWTFEEMPDAGGYRVISNGGRINGGIMPLDPESTGTPPSWMPDFGHDDVERLVQEGGGPGGRVHTGPINMPQGTIAVLGDPQGAGSAVWTGEYDD